MFCYYWRNLFVIPHCYHCLSINPNWLFSTRIILAISSFSWFPILLGGFSSHFSPCPGSPFHRPALVTVSASHQALGRVPARLFLCSHAPVLLHLAVQRGARAHAEGRRGVLVWDHPALLSADRGTKQTSLVWENKHHQPKAHNANVLHKAECDASTSKYNLLKTLSTVEPK